MLNSYDLINPPREKKFEKDSGEFSWRDELTRKICSDAKIHEKVLFNGQNIED